MLVCPWALFKVTNGVRWLCSSSWGVGPPQLPPPMPVGKLAHTLFPVTDALGVSLSFSQWLAPNRICSNPDSHLTLLLQDLSASHLAALKSEGWKNTSRSSLMGWRPFQPQERQRTVLPTGPNAQTPHRVAGAIGPEKVQPQGDPFQHFECMFCFCFVFFFSFCIMLTCPASRKLLRSILGHVVLFQDHSDRALSWWLM